MGPFLPPKPAPLSSSDEDKVDAGSASEKEFSIPIETDDQSAKQEPTAETIQIVQDLDNQEETLRVKKTKSNKEERQDSTILEAEFVAKSPKKSPKDEVTVNQIDMQTKENLTKKESTGENSKQKSKKVDKTVKAEINVESDGTFTKPKLRKSAAVKRQIEGPEMEKVQLKHHEFENEPQAAVEEGRTSIRVSTPLSLSIENVENQKTKSKIRKTKKKTTPDEVDKSAPDLKSMDWEERPEAEKENRMPNVLSPSGEEVSADYEAEIMESDAASEERLSPVLEPDQLALARKEVKTISNSSDLMEEVQAMDQGEMFEKVPTQLEKATASKEDHPELTATTSLPEIGESSVKQKKSSKKEIQAELKTEEDGTYEIPQLRKAETIKRPIPEAELEEVDLRHHEFENEPQTPAEELPSNLVTGNLLSINMDEEEEEGETKKKRVVVKKKTKKKVVVSPIKDSSEMQQTSGDDIESTKEIPTPEKEPEKQIVAQSEASVDVVEITKDEKVTTKKVVKDDNKVKPAKKENLEEGTFEKPKLKKAQTIKRAIEEPKLETVNLKAHAFEKQPQDIPNENGSKARVGRCLETQIEHKEEEETSKKVIKKKKKKQPSERISQPEEEDAVAEPEPVEEMEIEKPIKEEDIPPPAKDTPPEKSVRQQKPKEDLPTEPKTTKNGIDSKVKPKPLKKEPLEEGTFEKPALRKAKTVKREIEEPKLEKVTLKAHAFEKDPQDTPEEMTTQVKMGKLLANLTEETQKKKETVVVKKKKKKKQKELPAFLNFPTEQGEVADLDETKEKSPKILPVEPRTIFEGEDL